MHLVVSILSHSRIILVSFAQNKFVIACQKLYYCIVLLLFRSRRCHPFLSLSLSMAILIQKISAVCLLFCLHYVTCLFTFWIWSKIIEISRLFCHCAIFKFLIFSLLFTIVSCLFTFLFILCQLFVYFLNFEANKCNEFFAP